MDTLLPLNADDVRRFYQAYLCTDVAPREHLTIVFHDFELPKALVDGISAVKGTRLILANMREENDQLKVMEKWWDPSKRYLSVHDFTTDCFSSPERSAIPYAERGRGCDFTSFEFPRFDLQPDQIEHLLAVVARSQQSQEVARADRFFEMLGTNSDYELLIRSGPDRRHTLRVGGPSPWLEICGPLTESEVRFSPGCELFYSGLNVNGVIHCSGAINLLPLRGPEFDEPLCRELMRLGAALGESPVDLHFSAGRLTDVCANVPQMAQAFKAVFASDVAFSHLVEVGIGTRDSAKPLIRNWAATSNECVPGVHVGLGADPGSPKRFKTQVHVDFVLPDVSVEVNGRLYYDGAQFL
jgi:hypothetical protein